jgi:hypothetical protein
MYGSEHAKTMAHDFPSGFDAHTAEAVLQRWVFGAHGDHVLELTESERRRIFNLGYYTWVEQRGVSLGDFVARREQSFWGGLREAIGPWNAMIGEFNARTGALARW